MAFHCVKFATDTGPESDVRRCVFDVCIVLVASGKEMSRPNYGCQVTVQVSPGLAVTMLESVFNSCSIS